MSTAVRIRPYRSDDAAATLEVFLDAVTVTAAADYSPEQIAAWARPEERTVAEWDAGRRSRSTYVALVDGEVAGFSDVDPSGYVDMMFVASRFAGRGVATALLAAMEEKARALGATRVSADVSITARRFFARRGFIVHAEQHPVRAGVELINFRMVKTLRGSPPD
ncbi:GNAT family N-acetyltransferase [Microbacterium sp. ET2]|uniref:GNAT family N-acetyltransferase n=1 Tax=Microbacterium albipurpureum TaxID=3050384 RepID=UPI00259CC4CC|nr:GNAT family N-acetyltransferase [Microbacterium sp. ET2 (Ac-2212)]WJL96503.1 GNAT family N-acetyltransferase [Microbacterium sp. ET2 (Ac-2212)]